MAKRTGKPQRAERLKAGAGVVGAIKKNASGVAENKITSAKAASNDRPCLAASPSAEPNACPSIRYFCGYLLASGGHAAWPKGLLENRLLSVACLMTIGAKDREQHRHQRNKGNKEASEKDQPCFPWH